MIDFVLDTSEVDRLVDEFGSVAEKAKNKALKRSATKGAKLISQKVREVYNIKSKDFKASFKLVKDEHGYTLQYISRRLALYKYGAYPKFPKHRQQYSVKVKHEGGRKKIRNVFCQKMPMKGEDQEVAHVGLFQRTGKNRYPIKEKMGPSPPQLVEWVGVPDIEVELNEYFNKEFNHDLEWRLSNAKRDS